MEIKSIKTNFALLFYPMIERIKKIIYSELNSIEVFFIDSQNIAKIDKNHLIELVYFLKVHKDLYFDVLSCISAVDYINYFRVFYNLHSITKNLHLIVCTEISVNEKLPSLSNLYSSAEWHEREVYDMMGIQFENHPDLRRILLPDDWEGFPLLKNYQTQEVYHNIKVKY